jgi:RHS repeat-associated protein
VGETGAGPVNIQWLYLDGRRIGKFVMSPAGPWGALFYDDANGSLRVEGDGVGNVNCRADYYPFGEPVGSGRTLYESIQFAGLFTDGGAQDGAYSATHRRYNDTYYRWFSPDPLGKKAVSLANPQSWNMYAYVTDNPTTLNDPAGTQTDSPFTFIPNNYCYGNSCILRFSSEGVSPGTTIYGYDVFDTLAMAFQAQQQNSVSGSGRVNTPSKGGPDTTVKLPQKPGEYTERVYGPDGRAVKDIDHGHNHGAGDPHAHDWDWTKVRPRQPGRPLTPKEQGQADQHRPASNMTQTVIKASFWTTVGAMGMRMIIIMGEAAASVP